jgi:hypothetical protein
MKSEERVEQLITAALHGFTHMMHVVFSSARTAFPSRINGGMQRPADRLSPSCVIRQTEYVIP